MSQDLSNVSYLEEDPQEKLSKREVIEKYLNRMRDIDTEQAMLSESKKALKEQFVENNLLSKEELKVVNKLYSLMKSNTDMDLYRELYDTILG